MKLKQVFHYVCLLTLFITTTMLFSSCNKDDDPQHYLIMYIDGSTNFKANLYLQAEVKAIVDKVDIIIGTEKDAVKRFEELCNTLENTKYSIVTDDSSCTLGLFQYDDSTIKQPTIEITRKTVTFTKK